ncbi:MAG: VTT domain-containing protein [Candidatus Vogelbacteria bacterium]|nr:VTT domain-containing protein [Candidatus Vogelbacteria bacterium]
MIQWLEPSFIIQTLGLVGVWAIILAESGLFFGFFFPGDSLLFTAGLLASQGYLNIWLLVPGAFIAAVLGDNIGYGFGRRVGTRLFQRPDSRFFKKGHLEKTKQFYARYGKKTLILARFVPIVRTFAPILAGVALMRWRDFLTYNLVGAALWTIGVTFLGYGLGRTVPNIEHYLNYIIGAIIVLSLTPLWYNIKNAVTKPLP